MKYFYHLVLPVIVLGILIGCRGDYFVHDKGDETYYVEETPTGHLLLEDSVFGFSVFYPDSWELVEKKEDGRYSLSPKENISEQKLINIHYRGFDAYPPHIYYDLEVPAVLEEKRITVGKLEGMYTRYKASTGYRIVVDGFPRGYSNIAIEYRSANEEHPALDDFLSTFRFLPPDQNGKVSVRNERYGFSVEIPKGWTLIDADNTSKGTPEIGSIGGITVGSGAPAFLVEVRFNIVDSDPQLTPRENEDLINIGGEAFRYFDAAYGNVPDGHPFIRPISELSQDDIDEGKRLIVVDIAEDAPGFELRLRSVEDVIRSFSIHNR